MDGVFTLPFITVSDALTQGDKDWIAEVEADYQQIVTHFPLQTEMNRQAIIDRYIRLGKKMKALIQGIPGTQVYPFSVPSPLASEASRIMFKLRHPNTARAEFVYYTQRAYEMLFYLAFYGLPEESTHTKRFHYFLTPSLVCNDTHYALHNVPHMDDDLQNLVLCTLLRGALLPSLIFGKEVQENTSQKYVPDYALLKAQRQFCPQRGQLYVLYPQEGFSFFRLEELDGKDWVFADPINATAGSIITTVTYLKSRGISPRKIYCFHILSSLQGILTTVRNLPEVSFYTLWVDPSLDEHHYILPGLGDAGDRLNGTDDQAMPRNILQLLMDYGSDVASLYRPQIQKIESLILR